MKHQEIYDLIVKERFTEALAQIEKIPKPSNYLTAYRALIFTRTGKFQESEEEIAKYSDELSDDPVEKLAIHCIDLTNYFWLGKSDITKKIDEITNYLIQNSMKTRETTDWKYWTSFFLNMRGGYHVNALQQQKAIDDFQQALENVKEINNVELQMRLLNNQGIAFVEVSQPQRALQNYQQVLELHDSKTPTTDVPIALANMAEVFQIRGDYESALGYYNQAISVFEEYEHKASLAMLKACVASIHFELGDIEQAFTDVEHAIELRTQMGNKIFITEPLILQLRFFVELKQTEKAKQIYAKLRSFAEDQPEIEVLQLRLKFADIFLAKLENDPNHDEILEKIEYLITKNYFDMSYTNGLFRLYAEFIIKKIQSNTRTNLELINQQIARLQEINKQRDSVTLQCILLVLESYMEAVKGDIDSALEINDLAYTTANTHNHRLLALSIFKEKDQILKLSQFVESKSEPSFKEIRFQPFTGPFFSSDDLEAFFEPLRVRYFQLHNLHQVKFELHINSNADYHSFASNFINTNQEFTEDKYFFTSSTEGSVLIYYTKYFVTLMIFEGSSYLAFEEMKLIIDAIRFNELVDAIVAQEELTKATKDTLLQVLYQTFSISASEFEEEEEEITEELDIEALQSAEFKSFFHPIRLLIMKTLDQQYKLNRSEFQKLFGINSGALTNHINTLKKAGLIEATYEFSEERPQQFINISTSGVQLFNKFSEVMQTIV